MMDLIWGAISLLVPGAGLLGVWGLVLKLAAKLGFGWATAASTGPVLGLVAQLADFVLWIAKGILGYAGRFIGKGLDVLASDVRAAVTAGVMVWGAYALGGADWPWWRSVEPPAASSPASKSAPRPKACSDPLSQCFWNNLF